MSRSVEPWLAFARGRLGETLEQLESWVAVNSFTRHRDGVLAHGEQVIEAFAPLGFTAERIPAADPDLGDHLRLSRCGAGRVGVVALSHLDTVYPPDVERRCDFRWRDDGDTIRGPGVADIKGGTAVLRLALETMAHEATDLFEAIDWTLLFNAAEEEGCADFPPLARAAAGQSTTAACLVFEHATPLAEGRGAHVTVSRRGSARFHVRAIGRAAHAGSAHDRGCSAVRQLARIVEAIESMTAPERGLTFNVGVVRGGEVSNTVPALAEALVDMRADAPDDFDAGAARVLALAGPGDVTARADGFRCRIEVEQRAGYPPWPRNPASDALARRFAAAARAFGYRLVPEHRLGASDGNHVWSLAPTLDGLGPAGRHIHSPRHDPACGHEQESIVRASLADQAVMVALGVADLAARREQGGGA